MSTSDHGTRKHVLVLINKLSRGGAEKQLLLITRGLKTRYDFTIVTLYGSDEFESRFIESGIEIKHMNLSGSLFKPGNLIRILRLSRSFSGQKVDLIHSWLYHSNLVASFLKLLGTSRKLVTSVRGSNFWFKRQHYFLSSLTARVCDVIVTNSNQLVTEILSYCSNRDKIHVIPNGVNIHHSTSAPEVSVSENSVDDVITIGCVGRFAREKRYCDVIDAATILSKKHNNIRFILVGGRGEFAKYQEMIKKRNLEGIITLTGEVDNPLDYIKSFDIFLMASSHEGMPNSMMEAMTLGKPVVATRVGAIPDLVTPDINGLLVPTGTPAAIANALDRLIGDRNLMAAFGKSNIEKMQEFSIENMLDRYDNLYNSLITSQEA